MKVYCVLQTCTDYYTFSADVLKAVFLSRENANSYVEKNQRKGAEEGSDESLFVEEWEAQP